MQIMPPGVRHRVLSGLVDFIYNGNAKIASEDLDSMLALARHFKIKGLAEDRVPGDDLANQLRLKSFRKKQIICRIKTQFNPRDCGPFRATFLNPVATRNKKTPTKFTNL
jgi:hypothetical protein